MTRYYTEDEHPHGEYGESLLIANESGTVGVSDTSESEDRTEWEDIHLTPGLLREWAELIEFAYGQRLYGDNPHGSVEIGFRYQPGMNYPIEIVARQSGSDADECVGLATRYPRGEL